MRQTILKHPAIVAGLAITAICGAVLVSLKEAGVFAPAQLTGEAFYTSDEGKTYFTASSVEGSPITRNGKEAYRCFVFRCGDGAPFVGYLVRYPNGAPGAAPVEKFVPPAAAGARPADGHMLPTVAAAPGGSHITEYRRPGETKWQSSADMAAAAKIMQQRCTGGQSADVLLTSDTAATASE